MPTPIVYLPGAGGGAPDLALLRADHDATTRFEIIAYPGWQRYAAHSFSADALIDDLAAQVAARVPNGPIRIIGLSIGGHFGYATALRLQAMGREIGGLCAIDSFMMSSAGPSPGWQSRALAEGLKLLRQRRMGEFLQFARSKFWRALLRVAGGRLPKLLSLTASGGSLRIPVADPVFETELSMRMLIRKAAPWISSLDREPMALAAPSVLLRTALTASDDAAWRRRCPNLKVYEVRGQHLTLFDRDNVQSLRQAYLAATNAWRE